MNTTELFEFLLPQIEPLQLGFLSLIIAMMLTTIGTTHWYARNIFWERKWNNGTSDQHSNDLDIDHGSITDLWYAVATAPEKLAEIMPGMLLVVGLLGTFLGLGLALNHASHILGQTNALSPAGAASSMQDLMGLLQGLGTKFKTSTWGITGFLLLKVWSSLTRFDEKRLTWVIHKVKSELENRKLLLQKTEEDKQQTLFSQISKAAEKITQGINKNVTELTDSQKIIHQESLQYLQKGIKIIHHDLTNISTTIQSHNSTIKLTLEQESKIIHEDLIAISASIQSENLEIRHLLEKNIQITHQDLVSINTATEASSQAMAGFVSSTQTIINDMSAASNKMADGAQKVGVAGSSLLKAVDDFSTQFTQVLGDVRTDLSTAINDMSEQAAQTLEQGTKELGKATLEISTALGVLSQDVTTTMNGVKDSIEKSLKIQQEGAVLFRRSSDTLNENVTATTELVQKLGEDIRSGLQAVSDSGRRMASIGKSLENIVPQMNDLLPALEPLKKLHNQHQPLLEEMKALRTDLTDFNVNQRDQLDKAISMQRQALANVLAEVSKIRITP